MAESEEDIGVYREAVERWLPEYGYTPTAEVAERMGRYLARVAQANRRMRLVGAAEPEVLARRHLGESVAAARVVELGRQRVVDVGSGAGFPGLALALGWPELKTTLVESTGKKAEFLRGVIEELGVGAEAWHRYLERRPPIGGGPDRAAEVLHEAELVTVRALERMAEVPAWLGRWLGPQTLVAFWVTAPLAGAWRARYPGWRWGEFSLLPGSRERGIQLAKWQGST